MTESVTARDRKLPAKLGKYQILRVLGRGSMGVVYKARDPEIDRLVAIKTLQGLNQDSSKKLPERLLSEARSLGKLRHPNIITIFDAHFGSETPYLVTDFVSGETLNELLKREGPVSVELALFYFNQIAGAIDYAHRQGVIHRDLKPSNCMLEVNDRVYVLDFGIAKIQSHLSETLTADETIVGTPAYMAPEQINNGRIVPATDLFSFAVMAYQCITGKRPFEGGTYTETLGLILSQPPVPLSSFTDLPLALEAVFEKALAKDPDKRYPNAKKFVEAFAEACNLTELKHPRESAAQRHLDSLSAWDGKKKHNSRPLYYGNAVAPTSNLTNKNIFSYNNQPVASAVEPVKSKYSPKALMEALACHKLRAIIGVLAAVSLVCGIQIMKFVALDSDQAPEEIAAVQEVPADERARFNVVVGENSEVPKGKLASEMTDEELIVVLLSDDIPVRDTIEGLKEVEMRNLPDMNSALQYLLQSDSYLVRAESLQVIARTKDPFLAPAAVNVLNDHDPTVRKTAAKALASIGSKKSLGALKQRYELEDDQVVKREMRKAIEDLTGVPYR